MQKQGSLVKRGKLSPSEKAPNEKLLRSFYSKQKSKSEYSPPGNRSISKQQIRHQIKKVVYGCLPHDRQPSRNSDVQAPLLLPREDSTSIRTSLTPKNLFCPKKPSDREVKSSKAGDARGKELFTSSGRYDLRQVLQRKKEEDREKEREREREAVRQRQVSREIPRQRGSSMQKRNNYVSERPSEDDTIRVNEKSKDDSGLNVRACLTAEEYAKFGERFPQKFRRVGLLGRGGFSVVWLAVHRSTKRKVAVKQILTKNPHETHLKEIWFGSYFFEKGGEPREQFEQHVGINNLCRLYSHEIRAQDSWLYYEVCDESLGSSLFELKGQTVANERVYKIQHRELIQRMRADEQELVSLIAEVAKALLLINSHNIVHSDLKTENILLKRGKEGAYIRGVKLIDFGSSFLFTNLKQFSMATPEYMPPEILNYILFQNKLEYDLPMLSQMERYKNPWVIDIWSLGCILLEIVSGVPLWMSIETRVQGKSGPRVVGLFAVKNRVFSKIIQKQRDVVANLDYHLDHSNHSGIHLSETLRKALKLMLHLDPQQRISPIQLLALLGLPCEPSRVPSY